MHLQVCLDYCNIMSRTQEGAHQSPRFMNTNFFVTLLHLNTLQYTTTRTTLNFELNSFRQVGGNVRLENGGAFENVSKRLRRRILHLQYTVYVSTAMYLRHMGRFLLADPRRRRGSTCLNHAGPTSSLKLPSQRTMTR